MIEEAVTFIQVIAMLDLIGIALFIIIGLSAINDIHEKVNEIYREFKKGEWRFMK